MINIVTLILEFTMMLLALSLLIYCVRKVKNKV